MRYRLRTLMILLALGPPFLAGGWWTRQRIVEQRRRADFDRDSWDDVGGPGAIDVFESIGCILLVETEDEERTVASDKEPEFPCH